MPRTYSQEELKDLSKALMDKFVSDRFRAEEELSGHYHRCFKESYAAVSRVLSQTDNLFSLESNGRPLLIDGFLSVLRNMDRPTVSEVEWEG